MIERRSADGWPGRLYCVDGSTSGREGDLSRRMLRPAPSVHLASRHLGPWYRSVV